MRMSCNGCRVLRKACSEDCTIRPCLEWIKSSDSQANATVFLAKFYGRSGLINLINAGPYHLRPAIFRSLLFEACGRIVNRVSGVTGLICSGSWHLCEAAVEAVLKGAPIIQISSESGLSQSPLKASDIRHVSKDESSTASDQLHKVKSTRSRFKRSGLKPKLEVESSAVSDSAQLPWLMRCDNEFGESGVSRRRSGGESGESDRVSVETVEASLVERADCSGLDLDLNLGFWS